jgi:hypothetical protein
MRDQIMRAAARAQGMRRLGVKTLYQHRCAISGRKKNQPRSAICERCGRIGDMHMHHRDYTRPALTMWLCCHCHAAQQAEDRGAGLDCSMTGRYYG